MTRVALIMAGGSGERFWPVSRANRPKQMLPLISSEPLIVDTVRRVLSVCAEENIFIITNQALQQSISECLSQFPKVRVLAEPAKRNTAPCIVYATEVVRKLLNVHDDVSFGIFAADHFISTEQQFMNTVNRAFQVAEQTNTLVTLGIVPSRPETGYGYIERGNEVAMVGKSPRAFQVQKFHEKPELIKALEYITSGRFFWNSGMFFWTIVSFYNQLTAAAPQFAEVAKDLRVALENNNTATEVEDVFMKMPAESIDFALMEGASNVTVVESAFTWDDVGSWDSLVRMKETNEQGNLAVGNSLLVDSRNVVVYNSEDNHVVAVQGLESAVVVHTADATLVCNKDSVQNVRKIVTMLRESGQTGKL